MQAELLNLLDKSEFVALKILETIGFFWTLWMVFAKHFRLKNGVLKVAQWIVKVNEPELPQRKRNIRSRRKKPFDNYRS